MLFWMDEKTCAVLQIQSCFRENDLNTKIIAQQNQNIPKKEGWKTWAKITASQKKTWVMDNCKGKMPQTAEKKF